MTYYSCVYVYVYLGILTKTFYPQKVFFLNIHFLNSPSGQYDDKAKIQLNSDFKFCYFCKCLSLGCTVQTAPIQVYLCILIIKFSTVNKHTVNSALQLGICLSLMTRPPFHPVQSKGKLTIVLNFDNTLREKISLLSKEFPNIIIVGL